MSPAVGQRKKSPATLDALDDPTPPHRFREITEAPPATKRQVAVFADFQLAVSQSVSGSGTRDCPLCSRVPPRRDDRHGPLTFPMPRPRTPLRTDWIHVPENGSAGEKLGTFGTSSAENMRNRLFYIEFEIKKVDFPVERFGISSVPDISPNDKQEKHFAIVNLRHYRMSSFSYC
jgi:hypothetical protein